MTAANRVKFVSFDLNRIESQLLCRVSKLDRLRQIEIGRVNVPGLTSDEHPDERIGSKGFQNSFGCIMPLTQNQCFLSRSLFTFLGEEGRFDFSEVFLLEAQSTEMFFADTNGALRWR